MNEFREKLGTSEDYRRTGDRPERYPRTASKQLYDSNHERIFGRDFTCICGTKYRIKAKDLPFVCTQCQSTIKEV